MRYSIIITILVFLCIPACSRSKPVPVNSGSLQDFTPYLNLKPGITIKVIPYIGVIGYEPDVVRDATRKAEDESGETGTLISIDRDMITILPKGSTGQKMSYSPTAVKSIEVILSGT